MKVEIKILTLVMNLSETFKVDLILLITIEIMKLWAYGIQKRRRGERGSEREKEGEKGEERGEKGVIERERERVKREEGEREEGCGEECKERRW